LKPALDKKKKKENFWGGGGGTAEGKNVQGQEVMKNPPERSWQVPMAQKELKDRKGGGDWKKEKTRRSKKGVCRARKKM